MSPLLYALIVGWAVISAAIVGVWLWRYWREWARLREQEQEYADAWCATHLKHQDKDRYTTERLGAPE